MSLQNKANPALSGKSHHFWWLFSWFDSKTLRNNANCWVFARLRSFYQKPLAPKNYLSIMRSRWHGKP
ncbi:hypothetical protein, partial [Salinivibrio sp. EAGSL]|uniref:hypothetical protein n=1 Tax=Salinivibrio sp. EAGSL TaxID=2738468 RepID=UPI001C37B6A3